jgi:hypothetical protein
MFDGPNIYGSINAKTAPCWVRLANSIHTVNMNQATLVIRQRSFLVNRIKKLTTLVGKKFGRWTVIKPIEEPGPSRLECSCECGNTAAVALKHLKTGASVSCGCCRVDSNSTHYGSSLPEYTVWMAMKTRCHKPTSDTYKNYGARGISVCALWRNSFKEFISHIGRRPPGKWWIERINNDGDYEPGNVKWATPKEQRQNTRFNVNIELDGRVKCVSERARNVGVRPSVISSRINRGWSHRESVFGRKRK